MSCCECMSRVGRCSKGKVNRFTSDLANKLCSQTSGTSQTDQAKLLRRLYLVTQIMTDAIKEHFETVGGTAT